MKSTRALVGARTTPSRGHGVGISLFDTSTVPWSLVQQVELTNPGFQVFSERTRTLYVAHGDGKEVSSFKWINGKLELLNSQQTLGKNPAHIALSPTENFLVAVNHSSGSITSIMIQKDGSLGEIADHLEFQGEPGPHRTDQTGSKPHQAVFSAEGNWILVPDKGLDKIFALKFSDEGKFTLIGEASLRMYSGPRHLVLSADHTTAYVLNELSSTVAVLKINQGEKFELEVVQYLSTMDSLDPRETRGGEIQISPDQRFLFASNRGGAGDKSPGGPDDDTVRMYKIQDDKTLQPLNSYSTGGIRPRFFTINEDDGYLYFALEKSDSLYRRKLDSQREDLGPLEHVADCASPVHILFTRP